MTGRTLKALSIKDIKHLCKLLSTSPKELEQICSNIDRYYKSFSKADSKGKKREFDAPQGRLREILDTLNAFLQRVKLPDSVHGGIKGKSTKSNAEAHIGKPEVDTYDISNFFPSVPPARVYQLFNSRLQCSPDVARYLTRLTTYKGRIPQGSPTSSIVAALVAEPLALRLQQLAIQHGGDFTQYVDDITFSGPAHLPKLENLIVKIARQEGFMINPAKTKKMAKNEEQLVTGNKVNFGIDIPKEKITQVKISLSKIEKGEIILSVKLLRSLFGKIDHIKNKNPGAGKQLIKRLDSFLEKC